MKLYMFRTIPLSIIRSYSPYTQQWYMSYMFVESFRAFPSWSCSKAVCMTYTFAECTMNNSWWWTEELSETSRVSFQNKFEKLVHVVGFIIRHATNLRQIGTLRHKMAPLHCFTDTLQELREEKHCVRTYSSRPAGFVNIGVYCSETASQLCAQ
jgi:hypothetical protein